MTKTRTRWPVCLVGAAVLLGSVGGNIWTASEAAGDSVTGNPVAGAEIYDNICVACHGEDGTGEVPGAPDFTAADGVLAQSDDRLMVHIEEGFKSPGAMLEMPPKGGDEELTMENIMDVLAYMHKKFHFQDEF